MRLAGPSRVLYPIRCRTVRASLRRELRWLANEALALQPVQGPPLQYIAAETVAEAIALMGNGGAVVAGGTTIVPGLLDDPRPGTIIDITKIPDLRAVQDSGKDIQIGAAVSLERAAEVLAAHPSLRAAHDAASAIGNPHIRRLATVGGNICGGKDQVKDLTTALVALDGRVAVADANGTNTMAITAFLTAAASASRLVTAITIPISGDRRSSFTKFAWRRTSAPAILNAAAAARISDGRLHDVRIAVGATAIIPVRIRTAEAMLEGQMLDAAKIAEAATTCARATPVHRLTFTTADYVRSALARVMRDVISDLQAT